MTALTDEVPEALRLLLHDAQGEHDVERVAVLRQTRFTGPAYDVLRDELWLYAMPVLRAALRSGRIVGMCRRVGVSVTISSDDRQALHTSADERTALAVDTLLAAERYFRAAALRRGKWDASRGTSLTTFFVGSCLVKFPDVYARWSRLRADRVVSAYYGVSAKDVAGAVTSGGSPEEVAVRRDMVTRLFEMARPTGRAVLALMLEDYTYAEIGQRLGLSERAVEGHVYRIKRQARSLEPRSGSTPPAKQAS